MSEYCCYIVVEEENGQRLVSMQCAECHKENGKGYFWPQNWGYGDSPIVCQCGKIIHEGRKKKTKKGGVNDKK